MTHVFISFGTGVEKECAAYDDAHREVHPAEERSQRDEKQHFVYKSYLIRGESFQPNRGGRAEFRSMQP
jgi:hypothetical protein